MAKIIKHIKKWNKWRKYNANSTLHKILVLIGFVKSPTYYVISEKEDWE